MNQSSWRSFIIIWLLLLLFSLTELVIFTTRTANQFDYRPTILASRAGPPHEPWQDLNIYDGLIITQEFKSPATFITHLDLDIVNLLSAPADAQVKIQISPNGTSPLVEQQKLFPSCISAPTLPSQPIRSTSAQPKLPCRLAHLSSS